MIFFVASLSRPRRRFRRQDVPQSIGSQTSHLPRLGGIATYSTETKDRDDILVRYKKRYDNSVIGGCLK